MARYRIHLINSEFQSSDEVEHTSEDEAIVQGLKAAAQIACESLAQGEPNIAVELRIEQDDRVVTRRVLTLAVADLMVDE